MKCMSEVRLFWLLVDIFIFSISYEYFLDCWLCVVIFVKFLLVHIGRCSLLFFTSDCDRHSFLWGILRLPLFCLLIFVSIFLQILLFLDSNEELFLVSLGISFQLLTFYEANLNLLLFVFIHLVMTTEEGTDNIISTKFICRNFIKKIFELKLSDV